MRHVSDRRQERWVGHRGPDTEPDRPDGPDGKALPDGDDSQGGRLERQP